MTRSALACSALWLLAGCEQIYPDITWDRMINQDRGKAYAASPQFPDGKLMQAPPEHTVPAGQTLAPQPLVAGLQGNAYVTTLPIPLDRALLDRGRVCFETFCAACHGVNGSGESLVAHNMTLRKPPSLIIDPVRSFPAGRVFQVISAGYGLMPSYAAELPIHDRWAVVAYLHALQRSQASQLASLPADIRRRAEQELR